jgi:hypothetical protein
MMTLLLGGTLSLPGCGSTPPDPFRDVRMLTPAELGASNPNVDRVEKAERAHNDQFARGR